MDAPVDPPVQVDPSAKLEVGCRASLASNQMSVRGRDKQTDLTKTRANYKLTKNLSQIVLVTNVFIVSMQCRLQCATHKSHKPVLTQIMTHIQSTLSRENTQRIIITGRSSSLQTHRHRVTCICICEHSQILLCIAKCCFTNHNGRNLLCTYSAHISVNTDKRTQTKELGLKWIYCCKAYLNKNGEKKETEV